MLAVMGDEDVCPAKSTLLGAVKVIPVEYSNIGCRVLDILPPEPGTEKTGELLERLLPELTAITASPEPVSAFRGTRRWVQRFEPVPLPEPEAAPPRLKKGGVYLITGGLGGMGLVLAGYLVKTVQARLILAGRSVLPGKPAGPISKAWTPFPRAPV